MRRSPAPFATPEPHPATTQRQPGRRFPPASHVWRVGRWPGPVSHLRVTSGGLDDGPGPVFHLRVTSGGGRWAGTCFPSASHVRRVGRGPRPVSHPGATSGGWDGGAGPVSHPRVASGGLRRWPTAVLARTAGTEGRGGDRCRARPSSGDRRPAGRPEPVGPGAIGPPGAGRPGIPRRGGTVGRTGNSAATIASNSDRSSSGSASSSRQKSAERSVSRASRVLGVDVIGRPIRRGWPAGRRARA